MVQLPPAQPYEANAIETFAQLTTPNSQMNVDQLTNGQLTDGPIAITATNAIHPQTTYFHQTTNPPLSCINSA